MASKCLWIMEQLSPLIVCSYIDNWKIYWRVQKEGNNGYILINDWDRMLINALKKMVKEVVRQWAVYKNYKWIFEEK